MTEEDTDNDRYDSVMAVETSDSVEVVPFIVEGGPGVTTPSRRLKTEFSRFNAFQNQYQNISSQLSLSVRSSSLGEEGLKHYASRDPKQPRGERSIMRVIVTDLIQKIPCYYPNYTKEKYQEPNLLEIGWAFYDHITLARHQKRSSNRESISRTDPGDPKAHGNSRLYSFWKTPGKSLDDFGIGIGLYFNSIKVMGLGLLVAYLISIPNVLFYMSKDYGEDQDQSGLRIQMRGSAICTAGKSWVACESQDWCDIDQLQERDLEFATSAGYTFVRKSNCDGANIETGLWNLAALLTVGLITILFSWYQHKRQIYSDEDFITASDYSIWVNNPPSDAYDAEEWREYFSMYDEKGVASVTVLLDNQALLIQLLIQRLLRKELQKWLPDVNLEEMDDSDSVVEEEIKTACEKREADLNAERCSIPRLIWKAARPFAKPFNRLLSPIEVYEKLKVTSSLICEKQQDDYGVTDVIVTFETEKGQRNALKTLSRGKLGIMTQHKANINPSELFKDKILDIEQPAEPSAIRYLDVNTTPLKTAIQSSITLAITIALVALSAVIVNETRKSTSPLFAGIVTSVLNMLIPIIIKLLMLIEKHQSEDDRQKSLYIKVTLFRWVNTVITVKFVTPFIKTLEDGPNDLLMSIAGILVSEMFFVPLIGVCDIMGNISKHWFAPRARTLQQMLLCFKGTPYNIAEKYTDVTKVVFLAYYYCALNPNFLLMGFIALFVRYYADKFCLLRVWYSAPYIGGSIAKFSRQYFFPFAIVAAIAVAAYDWALFRFDRICDGLENVQFPTGEYIVTMKGKYDPSNIETINVTSETTYRVCSTNDCCQRVGLTWPPVPSRFQADNELSWMSDDQEILTNIYGWTSFAVVIIFFLVCFGFAIIRLILSQFKGIYKEQGKDQFIDFSSVKGIDGYIPQIFVGFGSVFPTIACDISGINVDLIGWNDPQTDFSPEGYDKHNLFHDKPMFCDSERPEKHLYDTIKCWAPRGRDNPIS